MLLCSRAQAAACRLESSGWGLLLLGPSPRHKAHQPTSLCLPVSASPPSWLQHQQQKPAAGSGMSQLLRAAALVLLVPRREWLSSRASRLQVHHRCQHLMKEQSKWRQQMQRPRMRQRLGQQ